MQETKQKEKSITGAGKGMLSRPSQGREVDSPKISELFGEKGSSEPGKKLALLLDESIEVDNETVVRRNFNITKANMRRLKSCVAKLNERNHKATQDDILNEILDDFFTKNKIA